MSDQQVETPSGSNRQIFSIFNSIFEPHPVRISLLYRFYWECCRSSPEGPYFCLVSGIHLYQLWIIHSNAYSASNQAHPSFSTNMSVLLARGVSFLPQTCRSRWWRFWRPARHNRRAHHEPESSNTSQWFMGELVQSRCLVEIICADYLFMTPEYPPAS